MKKNFLKFWSSDSRETSLLSVFIQTVSKYLFSILYVESTFPVTVENIKIKRYSHRNFQEFAEGVDKGDGMNCADT